MREENPQVPVVVMDGGNFLADPEDSAGDLRNSLLVRSFSEMGYDAVNVGPREAAVWSDLCALAPNARIPWVSANARIPSQITPVAPFLTFRFPELSVGVIGLGVTDEEEGTGPFDPLSEALGRALESLQNKVDRVIVIGHVPVTYLASLSRSAPRLTAILSGYGSFDTKTQPLTFGSTVAAMTGTEGKQMIDLRLSFSKGETKIVSYRLVPLDRSVPADPKWEKGVAGLLTMIREREEARARSEGPVSGTSDYAGVETCAQCHSKETEIWKKTAHARAFATLQADGEHFDPKCVGCHVTGWQQPGGFLDGVRTLRLKDVQCEACHGAGRRHVEQPPLAYGRIARPSQLCTGCHTTQTNERFDYPHAWAAVAH